MKLSCKFGEPSWCSFPLRVLTPKISTHGCSVANAKPKYPPDASGGYNNKQVVSIFKFGYPHLSLKEGPKVKSDHIRRFASMISYRLVSHCKPVGPIVSKLQPLLSLGILI